jgi:HNH endonuclease
MEPDLKVSYCDVKDVPLQIEHIYPKAKGGSNRISNLCLACDQCNKKKGTQDIEEAYVSSPYFYFLMMRVEPMLAIFVVYQSFLKSKRSLN